MTFGRTNRWFLRADRRDGYHLTIRVAGYGVGMCDHRQVRPYFSERNRRKGDGRHFLHVGPYCLRVFPRINP